MGINKAYKHRIYPNNNQKKYFSKVFGCVRFLYNKMLSDKKDYYKNNRQNLITYPSKYKEEFPFLKEIDSLALCNVQLDLNSAYNNFLGKLKMEIERKDSLNIKVRKIGKLLELIIKKTQ